MCGIAGTFSVDHSLDLRGAVSEIVKSQHPRGPDYQAVDCVRGRRSTAVLGHNRLSIIDLSARANQPMWDVERRFAIVFNGEIYNYLELRRELVELGQCFATQSDTEVILGAFKAWGTEALQRLHGMFAFALLDAQEEILWLCRDRFGKKPLYYYLAGQVLWFASTARIIAKRHGLQPNQSYISRGLRYLQYDDDSDVCQYEHLKSLPPGHFLEATAASGQQVQITLRRYYDLHERVTALQGDLVTKSTPQLIEMVRARLNKALEMRLRADVPVGVSLSGGLDSSLLAASLAQRHKEVKGFTFGHPSRMNSEGPLVRQLARAHRLSVHYVWPTIREVIQGFWDTLEAQDAPFLGGSQMAGYLVYQRARAEGVIVLLAGQGADEAFMGYRKFQLFRFQRLVQQKRYLEALVFFGTLIPTIASDAAKAAGFWAYRHRYTTQNGPETVLNLPDVEAPRLGLGPRQALWVRQALDFTTISLPTLLRYEDRNSMGNSIESRMPFVDHELVELGLALPDTLKLQHGYRKWVLREVARGLLPDSIRCARYKSGFMVEQAAWVDRGLGSALRTALHEREARVLPWLMAGVDIDQAFADRRLKKRWATLTEALTLIWLADRAC